jgi:transmembrane sensor
VQPAYDRFSPANFLTDDDFVNHQLAPTTQSTAFWEEWLRLNPQRHGEWKQAVELLEAIRLGLNEYAQTYLSDDAIHHLLLRIKQTNARLTKKTVRKSAWMPWVAAASVLLAIGLGVWQPWQTNRLEPTYERQIAVLKQTPTEKVNEQDKPQSFHLSDGSTVWLSPGSKFSYASDFNQRTRTVYLLGEATFTVTKNAHVPFLVYANGLVTKVIGTKFVVRAFADEPDVRVNVQSGQVSVYRDQPATKTLNRKGVLLHPNQQVVFSRLTEQFIKSLADSPQVLPTIQPQITRFTYDDTPLTKVFQDIEQAYGITIRYNQEALANCQLNASLVAEPFEGKLAVICKTFGATYEIIDGQVIINGGRCQ